MAAPDLIIKKGDTKRPLQWLLEHDAEVVDVSGATSKKFFMKSESGEVKVNGGACTNVNDGTDGLVQYQQVAADIDTAGYYYAEVQIVHADGKIETFPSNTYKWIQILEDLGD